jgi:K+-transporting ATPase ATPase B chain
MTTLTDRRGTLAWFVEPAALRAALRDSVRRLTPRYQWRNPVLFVVYVGAILTTLLWLQALAGQGEAPAGFILAVTIWLWATLLFANFAEAIAEGRSRAQAATLKSARRVPRVRAGKRSHASSGRRDSRSTYSTSARAAARGQRMA